MKKFAASRKTSLLLRNGRLLDPGLKLDVQADVLIERGRIARIGKSLPAGRAEVIDASSLIVTPGWFDMHVHFREPGREDEETVRSGCAAAAAGGFTGVCPMPNTEPAADSRSIIEYQIAEAEGLPVEVHPIAAATKGRQGQELSEMGDLVDAGAVAFSDDGVAIATAEITRRAMEYASMFGVPIIEHCEEPTMSRGGAMHEGAVSTRLGIAGLAAVSEELIVARDLMLAEYTGARLHVAHISTAAAVELVRHAKARGLPVTCEVTPHHFVLTDEAVAQYDANYKMNPPLRTEADRQAIIKGLQDGTIDVIATDHAPHSPEEKDAEFEAAPFGVLGLETAMGLILTKLVQPGLLTLAEAVHKVTVAPREILRLQPVRLAEGEPANLTLIAAGEKWTVDWQEFYSKSRNTPFHGWELAGRPAGVYNKNLLWLRSCAGN